MANQTVTFIAVSQMENDDAQTESVNYVYNGNDLDATYVVEYEVVQHGDGGGTFCRPKKVTKQL